jgi:predicted transposase YdaD
MTGNDRDRRDGDVPRTVHDALFKQLFSDPALAAQELRAVLPPALVASVDWSVMTLMPTSFVDTVFHQRTSDLVYQSRFLEGGDVIFWLLEHQSTEDWWMLERILDTKRMMWLRWHKQHPEARHLPVIVPVVVYNGPRPWRAPRDMHELYGLSEELRAALGPHVLSCTLLIDDLSAVEDEDLRARRMDAYARLCLFAMAHAAAEDFLDRLMAWQVELRLVFDAGDVERTLSFLVYTSRVHGHADPHTIRKRVAAVAGPKQEDAMQSFYDMVVQEGFDKGLDDGLEKGIEKGQRAMLLRLLGKRFGAVPEQIAARVTAAAPSELERWADRLLDAASLDDVFRSE